MLAAKSTFYRDDPDTFIKAIAQVLNADVRSKHKTKKMLANEDNILHFDNCEIEFQVGPLHPIPIELTSIISSDNTC